MCIIYFLFNITIFFFFTYVCVIYIYSVYSLIVLFSISCAFIFVFFYLFVKAKRLILNCITRNKRSRVLKIHFKNCTHIKLTEKQELSAVFQQ